METVLISVVLCSSIGLCVLQYDSSSQLEKINKQLSYLIKWINKKPNCQNNDNMSYSQNQQIDDNFEQLSVGHQNGIDHLQRLINQIMQEQTTCEKTQKQESNNYQPLNFSNKVEKSDQCYSCT